MKKTAEHSGNEFQSTNSGAKEIPLYLGQHKSELRSIPIDWKIFNIRITALESRRLKHHLEKGVKALYLQSMVVAAVLSDPGS